MEWTENVRDGRTTDLRWIQKLRKKMKGWGFWFLGWRWGWQWQDDKNNHREETRKKEYEVGLSHSLPYLPKSWMNTLTLSPSAGDQRYTFLWRISGSSTSRTLETVGARDWQQCGTAFNKTPPAEREGEPASPNSFPILWRRAIPLRQISDWKCSLWEREQPRRRIT